MIGELPRYFKDPHLIANLPSNAPVLLALSGGADSSALLYLLCELKKINPFPLYAVHVNHCIRGEDFGNEALRDQLFCEKICRENKVDLTIEKIDVPALAKSSGQSLETAAREARYSAFAKIMQSKNIEILVTAHNADDNFETQLFNICRGCGIEGLCGIPECRRFSEANGYIARPILSASKQEIFELCHQKGIEYVTDSTNFEDDCVRNKLRLNIIPALKEIFGSPERAGARLSVAAKEASDFIFKEAEGLTSNLDGRIDCRILCDAHPSVSKRAIMSAFENKFSKSLESVHVESILDFAAESKNGSLSLPEGTLARFEDGYLSFCHEKDTEAEFNSSYDLPLYLGTTYIDGTDFAISVTTKNSNGEALRGYEPLTSASLRADMTVSLSAKNRKEGDKILSGGMHKKVKKLMCDKKVPSKYRNSLPLIFSGDELIFVPLCAVSDAAKATGIDHIRITIHKKILIGDKK